MDSQRHVVCIFGGGIAGSEAASRFAARGVRSVIFEQNALPWGKIEYGLPRWHVRQRDQEEAGIDDRLDHPLIEYVPLTALGRDLSLEEVLRWGFCAIVLAVGAWRDRPLELPGLEAFEGRGFHYQNAFVNWFNQAEDPGYPGPVVELRDYAAVVGGGLASIDVVKILMIETTRRALAGLGHRTEVVTLEKMGIPKVLQSLGLTWEQLGLKGCTLYYRRRVEDMPLVPSGDDPSGPETGAAVVKRKILQLAQNKYLFRFEERCLPVGIVVQDGRLAGLRLRRTEVEDGRVRVVPDTDFSVPAEMIVSSIGSLPEPVPGIPLENSVVQLADPESGQVAGLERVFATGNAITGRGNIRASRLQGRKTADWILDRLVCPDLGSPDAIYQWVRTCQARVGYAGNYRQWIQRHRPVRSEEN